MEVENSLFVLFLKVVIDASDFFKKCSLVRITEVSRGVRTQARSLAPGIKKFWERIKATRAVWRCRELAKVAIGLHNVENSHVFYLVKKAIFSLTERTSGQIITSLKNVKVGHALKNNLSSKPIEYRLQGHFPEFSKKTINTSVLLSSSDHPTYDTFSFHKISLTELKKIIYQSNFSLACFSYPKDRKTDV